METVRTARIFDPRTGDIILRGAGADRLSQAIAAGLVSGEIRRDVETVRQENERLTGALAASECDRRREAHRASELRREKLNGYLRAEAVRENKRTLREIALGFAGLGVAVGVSVATIAITIMI